MSDLLSLLLKKKPVMDDSEALQQSIRHNIHLLIESRKSLGGERQQPAHSLYDYGLSTCHIGRSEYQSNLFCREIQQLLTQFEPRLTNIHVVVNSSKSNNGLLLLHIEGMMRGGARQKSVVFDSVFNLTSAQLSFEEIGFA